MVCDKMEGVFIIKVYFLVLVVVIGLVIVLLVIGLLNVEFLLSEKGFFGMVFMFSLFVVIMV